MIHDAPLCPAEHLQTDPDERPSWLQPIGVRLAIILGLSAAFWAVVLVVVVL